jgi:hypothetical protein
VAGTIHAELEVEGPGECRVADLSRELDGSLRSIRRSAAPDDDGRVTREFSIRAGESPEFDDPPDDLRQLFTRGSVRVYRIRDDADGQCSCDVVECFGCPVRTLHADGGTLFLSFYAPEIETLRRIVRELRDTCERVHLRQLTRTTESGADPVYFDRGTLTARQREVLATAHEMGYFDHPKGANAGEVAGALGISSTTLAEHLSAAQRKLLDRLLD